jgi:hypothetical protein
MTTTANHHWDVSNGTQCPTSPVSLRATDASLKTAAVSPDMSFRSAFASMPVKGILKPPSWSHLQQQCPPPTASRRHTVPRAVTADSFPRPTPNSTSKLPCFQEPTDAASRRRRCVSFSDSMCRWKNEGSSYSLNAGLPIHRTHFGRGPSAAQDTSTYRSYQAAAAPTPASHEPPMPGQLAAVPDVAALSRQSNHVWRSSRPTYSSSSQAQPPRKPKRTTADADLNAPMRKPQRRKSNETEPPTDVVSDTTNGNVFQSSVQSFLMNARVPARSKSSSSPAAFSFRGSTTQAMDMS